MPYAESQWFVEFSVLDEDRYGRLVELTAALADAKARQGDAPLRSQAFERFLDDEARARSVRAAAEIALERAAFEAAQARGEKYEFQTDEDSDWSLAAIVEAISDGEYDILPTTRSGSIARLQFEPQAGPYGGVEAFSALIRLFGQRVLREVG